ncbi:hypothetical protein RUM44_000979 [Polyplax serrata]|uniref:Uncharacterized protein n=1 Tax=Polyplax serrata TaxID=468196 RepID=A0ABR1B6H8_POLSC
MQRTRHKHLDNLKFVRYKMTISADKYRVIYRTSCAYMSSSKIVPLPPGPQFNPPGEHHPEGFETFKEKPLLLILRLRLICSSKE